MKQVLFLFFLSACFLVSNAADPQDPHFYKILRSDFNMEPHGPYQYGYETENAIQHQQTGDLKTLKNEEGKDENVIVMRGSYSYVDPNGTPITVTYYADETGFHAEGAHIPVPNAVPGALVGTTKAPRRQ